MRSRRASSATHPATTARNRLANPAQDRGARRSKQGRLAKPRLLIVGCGDIGARIVARLGKRFRIFALTASGERASALRAAGALPLTADLDVPQSLRRLRGLAQFVIHLAPPPGDGDHDPRGGRLRAVLARAHRPSASVYVGTTGIYGDRAGAVVDETSTPAPASARARRRLDAERGWRRPPWSAAVLRAPGIYAGDRLPLARLRDRVPVAVAAEDGYTNHVHADDLARLCVAALLRGGRGRIYNAVDGSMLKTGDFFDLVADRCGLPRPPRVARAQLRQQLSPIAWSFLSESRRVVDRRINGELRIRLRYPTVAAGLADR
jgi:nucleoside-diphosphate-sugar epimerase